MVPTVTARSTALQPPGDTLSPHYATKLLASRLLHGTCPPGTTPLLLPAPPGSLPTPRRQEEGKEKKNSETWSVFGIYSLETVTCVKKPKQTHNTLVSQQDDVTQLNRRSHRRHGKRTRHRLKTRGGGSWGRGRARPGQGRGQALKAMLGPLREELRGHTGHETQQHDQRAQRGHEGARVLGGVPSCS